MGVYTNIHGRAYVSNLAKRPATHEKKTILPLPLHTQVCDLPTRSYNPKITFMHQIRTSKNVKDQSTPKHTCGCYNQLGHYRHMVQYNCRLPAEDLQVGDYLYFMYHS